MGVVAEDHYKLITRCFHCGEECAKGLIYCKDCKTKPQREAMDKENREIMEEARKRNEKDTKATLGETPIKTESLRA